MQVSVSEMEAGLWNEGNLYLRSYLSTLQPARPAVTEKTPQLMTEVGIF